MSKSIEDKYKVLTQVEHVLLRPQTYVGSNRPTTKENWLVNEEGKISKKEITYIPSFIKIFDEVITNSVDESKRKGSKLNIIKVTVNDGKITIWDNGGIPVVIHKEYKTYVPEVIFGNLMSGSNYDDSEHRLVAGLNGLGAKLTNIFSSEFNISTCDGKNIFKQTFSNNMRKRNKAIIKESTKCHTEISFIPDFEKFGMNGIDDSHFKMIEKRVYDIAACNPQIKVYFNGKIVNIKSFEDYIKLYTEEFLFEVKKSNGWSFGIASSENGFQQVSFVNTTETYDGGTHVDYVTNQVVVYLREYFLKKHKVDVKPSELKNHMFIFLNSSVINPSFSSQTKEKLITEIKDFGTTFELSSKILQQILKSEIVNSILDWIEQKKNAEENKIQRDLNKKLSKIKVEKLIDSKGKDRWKHTIGLFEGDCLHEDTNIRVLRDGNLIDVKIKDVKLDDMVITHNNRFQNINAITKSIQYKNIIKTKNGDIICSSNHKFWIYDITKNEFYFEKFENIDKSKHKLVKNQLCFMDALLEIDLIEDSKLLMKSGEVFEITNDHKLCVYNIEESKFEMAYFNSLDKDKHLIVNTFTI